MSTLKELRSHYWPLVDVLANNLFRFLKVRMEKDSYGLDTLCDFRNLCTALVQLWYNVSVDVCRFYTDHLPNRRLRRMSIGDVIGISPPYLPKPFWSKMKNEAFFSGIFVH